MPKTLQAQSIANIGNVRFVVDGEGHLEELRVSCEVNYGQLGITEDVDIKPRLSSKEVRAAETLYQAIKKALENIYLK